MRMNYMFITFILFTWLYMLKLLRQGDKSRNISMLIRTQKQEWSKIHTAVFKLKKKGALQSFHKGSLASYLHCGW